MSQLANPLSRRAWKRWAYSQFEPQPKKATYKDIPRPIPPTQTVMSWSLDDWTSADKIMLVAWMGFLALASSMTCLTLFGFWVLITKY